MRKNVFITIMLAALLLASQTVSAQSSDQTPSSDKKISYNMINEYGFFVGGILGVNGTFVNSIKFKTIQKHL